MEDVEEHAGEACGGACRGMGRRGEHLHAREHVGEACAFLTWLYLSMNMSAFGTLESPRCMREEPTHEPHLAWVVCSSWCIARVVRGACCTRCSPWPVSRCAYGLDARTRSSSAKYQSRNMSFAISRHRVSDCSTNAYCFA